MIHYSDARCRHCGKPPDADGDHSCPCPYTDTDCQEHPPIHAATLRLAADALETQPPKLRAQYVAILRLYADEPWRLASPPPTECGWRWGLCAGCDLCRVNPPEGGMS